MNKKQQQQLYLLLGENIKIFRNKKGLTQEQLADEIGLTRTSIVNIEQGRQHAPLHLLLQIAKVLRVNFETIIPKEMEYAPAKLMDESSLKDVKDKDKQKLTSFYEQFLKTSENHE